MKLLKTIENYASFSIGGSTHSNGDELGDRIDMNPQEGHVEKILLVHTFTQTMNGSTYTLQGIAAATPTSILDTTNHTVALQWDLTPGGSAQGGAINFTPKDVGTACFHIVGQFWTEDCSEHTPIYPYVTVILGLAGQTTGIFTTKAYLYGSPHKFSNHPIGTVVDATA